MREVLNLCSGKDCCNVVKYDSGVTKIYERLDIGNRKPVDILAYDLKIEE
ncbi:MAG: hypothetical protein ACE5J4_01335 [Candidatus Aenigmatarchaeota archaeon]